MANFGLQQYYTNSQQNRFAAEEAQKERDWRSSEAWKSFGRDLLGNLGKTGMNIGQAFAEDYTPTREQAREFGKTKMGWEQEDRDTAAARLRAEAAATGLGLRSPYGDRPEAGVEMPTPAAPESAVQRKMAAIGAPVQSTPLISGGQTEIAQLQPMEPDAPVKSAQPLPSPAQRQAKSVAATGQSPLPQTKQVQAQGAVQPAAAPRVVPPTSTPTPPAGQTWREKYTFANPEFDSQESMNRVLEAARGDSSRGFSKDDIAIAQLAVAKAEAAQRANQAQRAKMLLERDKALLPLYIKGMEQKFEGRGPGKNAPSFSVPANLINQGRATEQFGSGQLGNPLDPNAPPKLPPVGGGGAGIGAGGMFPQPLPGMKLSRDKGDLLTAGQAYALTKSAAKLMQVAGKGTPEEVEASSFLKQLEGMNPKSGAFVDLYARAVGGPMFKHMVEVRGGLSPSSREVSTQDRFETNQARLTYQFEQRQQQRLQEHLQNGGKVPAELQAQLAVLNKRISEGTNITIENSPDFSKSTRTKSYTPDAQRAVEERQKLLDSFIGGQGKHQVGDIVEGADGRMYKYKGGGEKVEANWELQP